MAGAVRVTGLTELNRALTQFNKDVKRDMNKELRVVVEPVRALAEQLAVGNISNIGAAWARMRVGITARVVYVAPRTRPSGRGTGRPNFGPLLLNRAMTPALAAQSDEIERGVENMIDRLADKHGF